MLDATVLDDDDVGAAAAMLLLRAEAEKKRRGRAARRRVTASGAEAESGAVTEAECTVVALNADRTRRAVEWRATARDRCMDAGRGRCGSARSASLGLAELDGDRTALLAASHDQRFVLSCRPGQYRARECTVL